MTSINGDIYYDTCLDQDHFEHKYATRNICKSRLVGEDEALATQFCNAVGNTEFQEKFIEMINFRAGQEVVYPYVIWGTNDGDGGPSWEDVIRGVQPDISMRFLVPDRHQLFFVFVQGNSDRRNPIGHFICADYRYHNLQTNLYRIYDSYDFYQWRWLGVGLGLGLG